MHQAKPTTRMQYSWLLSALGSGGLILAMWAPFYRLDFGVLSPLFQQLGAQAQQFGVLAPFVSAGANQLAHTTNLGVNAWDAFDSLKIVWLALGGIALALALLSYTGRASGVGRYIALAGAAAEALVVYRMLHRPLPHSVLALGAGAWLMLVAALAMIVAGRLYDGSAEANVIMLAPTPGAAAPTAPPLQGEIRSWPSS